MLTGPNPETGNTRAPRLDSTRFEDPVSLARILTLAPVHAAAETREAKAMQHVFTDRSDAHTEASR